MTTTEEPMSLDAFLHIRRAKSGVAAWRRDLPVGVPTRVPLEFIRSDQSNGDNQIRLRNALRDGRKVAFRTINGELWIVVLP